MKIQPWIKILMIKCLTIIVSYVILGLLCIWVILGLVWSCKCAANQGCFTVSRIKIRHDHRLLDFLFRVSSVCGGSVIYEKFSFIVRSVIGNAINWWLFQILFVLLRCLKGDTLLLGCGLCLCVIDLWVCLVIMGLKLSIGSDWRFRIWSDSERWSSAIFMLPYWWFRHQLGPFCPRGASDWRICLWIRMQMISVIRL